MEVQPNAACRRSPADGDKPVINAESGNRGETTMTTASLTYAATGGSTYRMPVTGGYLRRDGRQCMCGTLSTCGLGPTTLWRKMTPEDFAGYIESMIAESAVQAIIEHE
jgi:hypothetical protein